MDIIQYLLSIIQYLYQQNCWLIHFICRYIPLKQWAFDDSHSQKYQKFKIDELPLITDFRQDWTYRELIPYYEKRYGKKIRPISRRSECDIPDSCTCPRCDAPKPFLYKNNGSKGQLMCKICDARFSPDESWSYVKKKYKLNVTNFPFFVIVNSLSLLGPFPSFSDIVPHIHLETNIHNDYEYGLYYRMFQYIQKLVYKHECS